MQVYLKASRRVQVTTVADMRDLLGTLPLNATVHLEMGGCCDGTPEFVIRVDDVKRA